MYNQILNIMDEMLNEVFDDLVSSNDQNLILGPYYAYDTDGVQHTFNWQDALHYLNLSGLSKATEYIQDNNNNPSLSFLVGQYNLWLNGDEDGNINPLFNVNSCN